MAPRLFQNVPRLITNGLIFHFFFFATCYFVENVKEFCVCMAFGVAASFTQLVIVSKMASDHVDLPFYLPIAWATIVASMNFLNRLGRQ